jgi:4-hydroxysphinganine ceramide fatty acyl 2-hydroxylase
MHTQTYGAFFGWTLLEYVLHRWFFHCEHWMRFSLFGSRAFVAFHFVMHGVHHLFPSDSKRCVCV